MLGGEDRPASNAIALGHGRSGGLWSRRSREDERCQALSYLASRLLADSIRAGASMFLPCISATQASVTLADADIQAALSASLKVRMVLPLPSTILRTAAPASSHTLPASLASGMPEVWSITLRASSGRPSYFALFMTMKKVAV